MRRRKPTAFSTDPFSLPEYGVAEPRLEPVVVAEHGEHANHCHLVPRDAVARTGGVAGRRHAGSHADVVEDLGRPLAHAFRVLARHRHAQPHVRIRERDHQAMRLRLTARDDGQGDAEIDLRRPRLPSKVEETLRGIPVRLPPTLHVPLHPGIRAREPVLGNQPVVHAPGGMTLLARQPAVRLQPAVHDRHELVQLRAMPAVRGPFRAQIRHIRVLRDRPAIDMQPPRYLRARQPLTVESPDIVLNGHRYRHNPFLPGTPAGGNRPDRIDLQSGNIQAAEPMPLHITGKR